jgi:hypothetical protein
MSKLEELIKSRPDFGLQSNKWFVGSYSIKGDWIGSDKPLEDEGPEMYFPLTDPTLFLSFVRLGVRGEPSESKILAWINEHGLLERAEEEPEVDDDNSWQLTRSQGGIVNGMLNQAPISIEQFRAEVLQARSALRLYYDLRGHNSDNLMKRLTEMRENPASRKVGPLSEMDHHLVDRYAGPKKLNWPMLQLARYLLERFVERKLSSVQLSFWNVAPETTATDGEWTNYTDEYVPAPSWRCPDLLSMLYLQFYLLMVNAVPLKICEHPRCQTPFPANRKDKRFCTDTCRSGARRYA